jgi:hypothetical protein
MADVPSGPSVDSTPNTQKNKTGYRLEDRQMILGRGKNFLFFTASRAALKPTQPPIQWVPAVLSASVKRLRGEADHTAPSRAEVKKV